MAGLRRWSGTAYGCVSCLIVTGEYQAARQISPIQALWSTRYGVTLLVKVAVVVLMLAAALPAQHRVLALAGRGTPTSDPTALIRRGVRVEAALAAVVLAVTALLVASPPASSSYGPAVDLTTSVGSDRAHVHVHTTRRGPEDITP